MAFHFGNTIVKDGLVLYLDAANTRSYISGSTAWNDLTTNNNNGTLINGPTFSSVNLGSIVFDGINDYVRIPSASSFVPSNDITINYWQNITGYDSNVVMISNGAPSGGTNELMIWNSNNTFANKLVAGTASSLSSAFWLYSSLTPPLNTWTNVCVTRAGSLVSIYFNGVFDSSNNQSGTMAFASNAPLLIGVDSDGPNPEGGLSNYFKGRLPNLSMYNRALSAQEILQNYKVLKGRYGL